MAMRGRNHSLRIWILASTWTQGVSWGRLSAGFGVGLRPWSRSPREFLGTSPLTSLFPWAVCIVGPNGVGKSTLLLLLTGKLTPVSPGVGGPW